MIKRRQNVGPPTTRALQNDEFMVLQLIVVEFMVEAFLTEAFKVLTFKVDTLPVVMSAISQLILSVSKLTLLKLVITTPLSLPTDIAGETSFPARIVTPLAVTFPASKNPPSISKT